MDTSLYNFEITLKIETTLNEILLRLTFDLDGVARNQNFSLKKYIFQKTLFKDFKAMILSALSHLFVFGPDGFTVQDGTRVLVDDEYSLASSGFKAGGTYNIFLSKQEIQEKPVESQEEILKRTRFCRECGNPRLADSLRCNTCNFDFKELQKIPFPKTPVKSASCSGLSLNLSKLHERSSSESSLKPTDSSQSLEYSSDSSSCPVSPHISSECGKCKTPKKSLTQKVCMECGERFLNSTTNSATSSPAISRTQSATSPFSSPFASPRTLDVKNEWEQRGKDSRKMKHNITTPESSPVCKTDSKQKLIGLWGNAVNSTAKPVHRPLEFTKSSGGILEKYKAAQTQARIAHEEELKVKEKEKQQTRRIEQERIKKEQEYVKKGVEKITSDLWTTIFKGKKGIQTWAVKDEISCNPVLVGEDKQHRFCNSDVVIVFQSIREYGPYHIYYWFGSKSAPKKKEATVDRLVPALDDIFGGRCAHHREVEGHESQPFLALYKKENGISVEDSNGVSTWISTNLENFKPVLLHVKGKKNVGVTPVLVSYESLNSGDVFILDTGLIIFCWNGISSSRAEKATGIQTVLKFRDSRGGKPTVVIVDEGKETQPFWDALGGKGKIKSADEVEDDDHYERGQEKFVKLYHVSDATGKLIVSHIASPPLNQMSLNQDDCHILDIGTEIFVWIGQGCTDQERSSAMSSAEEFLRTSNRPSWVPITRFLQGYETPTFQSQFVHWTNYIQQPAKPKETLSTTKKEEINVEQLINRSGRLRKVDSSCNFDGDQFETEGKFKLKIYRIENFEKAELDKKEYGVFYSGDSYVIHFIPDPLSKITPIVYFWLGRHSSQDEKGGAALHAKEIAGGKATHCRISQGKEPPHFVNLFRGNMVVRDGGVASGFSTLEEETVLFEGEPELFHVKGTNSRDTRAVQVALKCSSLNSADSFVLNCEKLKKQYIWNGKGCEEIEKEYADKVAKFLREISPHPENEWTIIVQSEEEECYEWWEQIGGKTEYLNSPELAEAVKEPRLFHCSNASGTFTVEEIYNFNQEDLALDDIFILDTFTTVFVWVGPESNDEEKQKSFETALEYVYACSLVDGRDTETPVVCTAAGFEPPMFTCWFHPWDEKLSGKDNYALLMEGLTSNNGIVQESVEDLLQQLHDAKSGEIKTFYKWSELRRDLGTTVSLPSKYIDASKLELYLFDDEFEKLFKMTKTEWLNWNQPEWKKRKAKSALGLI